MSLDVYLSYGGDGSETKPADPKIYVRENGQTVSITRDEWDRRHPRREPVTVATVVSSGEVYTANITHNLNTMAREAGIYSHLWRPDEIGVTKAGQLIEPLRDGLARLQSDPEQYKQFNPSNGWGSYEGLVHFVADYLAACEAYPDADVSVSR